MKSDPVPASKAGVVTWTASWVCSSLAGGGAFLGANALGTLSRLVLIGVIPMTVVANIGDGEELEDNTDETRQVEANVVVDASGVVRGGIVQEVGGPVDVLVP